MYLHIPLLPNSAQDWLCLRGQFACIASSLSLLALKQVSQGSGFGRPAEAHGEHTDLEALPAPLPTSGVVGDDGHGEVHLIGVHVWGGADGIVARLQQ